MGGTAPICPFCRKYCAGLKDHIRAKHPNRYPSWISSGQLPYWWYDEQGELKKY